MKIFVVLLLITTVAEAQLDTTKTLKDYAGPMHIGTAVKYDGPKGIFEGPVADAYRPLVKTHSNFIQPVIFPAWGGFFPEKKPADIKDIQLDFSKLNALVNWGKDNGMAVMHCLLFAHNRYYPDWFKTADFTPEELDWLMKHIIESALASNDNGEKVDYWNLINEVIVDGKEQNDGRYLPDGTADTRNVRWVGMGWEDDASGLTGAAKINDRHPVFIRKAFEYASSARGKLTFRDHGAKSINAHSDAMYQLVKHLQNKGVRIDAVGLQVHHSIDNNLQTGENSSFRQNVRRFRELGVDVNFSEVTIGCGDRPAGYEEIQEDYWYRLTKMAREEGVQVMSMWHLVDDMSRPGEEELLFDTNFRKKGAYYEVLRALYETWEQTGVLLPATDALPGKYNLAQNYPNPFNPTTTLKYTLRTPGQVTLTIYNVLGKAIRTLVDEQQAAGTKEVVWDGMSDAGVKVSSGIYYYRLETEDASKTMKMMLIK